MRITIKEIVNSLGVHHSTVSRALRMDPRVKPETGDKIRKYAKENGYYINLNALRLRGSVRNTIAMIVPEINHRFFSNIINYITDLAYENNFVISMYQSNNDYNQECSIIEKVIQQDVAGVIASVSGTTHSGDYYNELKRMQIPLVFFDRVLTDVNTPCVTTNNREVVETLVEDLVGMGCKRIAHVSGPDHLSVFHDRNLGYRQVINRMEPAYFKELIVHDLFTIESGRKAAKVLFTGTSYPDAVISTSYFLTIGIITYLTEHDISVPEDVMMAGFGDRLFNSLLHPSIISVEQPEKEIAEATFKLLMQEIDKEGDTDAHQASQVQLKSTIIYPDKQLKNYQYVKRNLSPDQSGTACSDGTHGAW